VDEASVSDDDDDEIDEESVVLVGFLLTSVDDSSVVEGFVVVGPVDVVGVVPLFDVDVVPVWFDVPEVDVVPVWPDVLDVPVWPDVDDDPVWPDDVASLLLVAPVVCEAEVPDVDVAPVRVVAVSSSEVSSVDDVESELSSVAVGRDCGWLLLAVVLDVSVVLVAPVLLVLVVPVFSVVVVSSVVESSLLELPPSSLLLLLLLGFGPSSYANETRGPPEAWMKAGPSPIVLTVVSVVSVVVSSVDWLDDESESVLEPELDDIGGMRCLVSLVSTCRKHTGQTHGM
jgi:hypothetical protein